MEGSISTQNTNGRLMAELFNTWISRKKMLESGRNSRLKPELESPILVGNITFRFSAKVDSLTYKGIDLKRLDWIGIAFVLISISFYLYGMNWMDSNTEDVLQWLPDRSEARKDYNFFSEKFGSDDFLVITWPECTLDDPRLRQLANDIEQSDTEGLLQSVITGDDIAQRLSEEIRLPRWNIIRRFQGVFFGLEDPDLTCVFIELSDKGTADRYGAMELTWRAIENTSGLSLDDVTIAGYPYVATVIDKQLKESIRYCLYPSIVLATLVSLLCLRNLQLAMVVFVVALGSAAVSLAFIPFCGYKMGGLMTIIPALVFVLATSGSIHLIRYSLNHIGDVNRLLEIGWKPCTVSTVTTAVGMLSLTRSDFPAIRNFGFFCASGVVFSLMFQLILVPWLLNRFGQAGLRKLAARHTGERIWQQLMSFVYKHKIALSLLHVVLMMLGFIGLSCLQSQVEVEKLFRSDAEVISSLERLEHQLGPMDQTEVLLVFRQPDADSFPDRVRYVRQIHSALSKIPQVEVAYSLINFLPLEPGKGSVRSFAQRSTYHNILRKEREKLGNDRFLSIDKNSETWRISLRFPFTEESNFGQLASDVESVMSELAKSMGKTNANVSRPELIYSGKTHLFHHAQETLLEDLFYNFMLAFVIITPMLMLVLRAVRLGLVAMLPNLFPTLIVFGGLGWIGYSVDLAVAMTACVALGIAVDDTTHFLVRFRDHGGSLGNVVNPIRETISQCGPAMFHTTLIASSSLMMYYFGEMLVVAKFAIAISSLLVIALIADVIMLPAVLYLIGGKRGES